MDLRLIARLLGIMLASVGASMSFALVWAIIDRDSRTITAFVLSICIAILLGIGLHKWGRRGEDTELRRKEGLILVTLTWLLAAAIGALPYLFSGVLPNYIDAFFESMSGFTTTGSTVFAAVEGLPRGILFWRDFTHWLGGMGIIVLFIAVLPQLGVGARHLYRSEIPGPPRHNLKGIGSHFFSFRLPLRTTIPSDLHHTAIPYFSGSPESGWSVP